MVVCLIHLTAVLQDVGTMVVYISVFFLTTDVISLYFSEILWCYLLHFVTPAAI